MYLGVDIGGTKTLVAVLDAHGVIVEHQKFPTPTDYDEFLRELRQTINSFGIEDFRAGGIGMPVTVYDREHGRAISFGNLPWRNVSVQHDVERISHCPMATDNDAKLAGLSEAMLLKDRYDKVLYITVSTGIGIALIDHGRIDENIGDGGGRPLLLEHHGRLVPWESFASGHAIVQRFGKLAKDITDQKTWHIVARDLAQGLIELIALTEPEVIVIGGSVGTYFNRYGILLAEELKKYKLPLVDTPPIMGAQRPEQAVIYGCYDYAKQVYPHAAAHH
jgi:predicted NBD/HSP70 family sugar kinase